MKHFFRPKIFRSTALNLVHKKSLMYEETAKTIRRIWKTVIKKGTEIDAYHSLK